jgi:tRNA(Arg) A34 adenosine deaminase TadA
VSSSREEYAEFMAVALEEAKQSLREGNKGFGAVLVRNGTLLERTHDTEVTDSDPTAHAEIKLVRSAAMRNLGGGEGCTVVSTHEPCPMCAGALVWAKISEIVYGTSIEQSKKLGRTMVDLKCEEIVSRAPWKTRVIGGVLANQCSRLYDSSVRNLVKQFKDGRPDNWRSLGLELASKRTIWFEENKDKIIPHLEGSEVERAYKLILMKVGIAEKEAPIIEKTDDRVVFHSENPCPALDACEILGLDTRVVCRLHTEEATDALIKKLNPKLKFTRNYAKLRPDSPFCEEIIEILRDDPTQGE